MGDDESRTVIAAAEAINLELPRASMPGVLETRRMLDLHRATIAAFFDEHPEA